VNEIEYEDQYFAEAIKNWHKISYPTFSLFLLDNISEFVESALDLGCGDGFYGKLLKERAFRLVGCDSSKTAGILSSRNPYYDRFIFKNIEEGNPGDIGETFDLIFTSEVIEHLRDYRKLIRFAYRLLNNGGKFILTTTTYYLYLFYYLIYSDPFKPKALAEFAAGLVNEDRASAFVRHMWTLTGGHHHGFMRKRFLKSIEDEGFIIKAVRYANVQPVFPIENMRNKSKLYGFFLNSIGKSINGFFKRSGIYGPNILVAARKEREI
jgi:SAM-dependent methyltransferase